VLQRGAYFNRTLWSTAVTGQILPPDLNLRPRLVPPGAISTWGIVCRFAEQHARSRWEVDGDEGARRAGNAFSVSTLVSNPASPSVIYQHLP